MTEPSPWDVEHLDLDAYLARVGVPASAPSREALDALASNDASAASGTPRARHARTAWSW